MGTRTYARKHAGHRTWLFCAYTHTAAVSFVQTKHLWRLSCHHDDDDGDNEAKGRLRPRILVERPRQRDRDRETERRERRRIRERKSQGHFEYFQSRGTHLVHAERVHRADRTRSRVSVHRCRSPQRLTQSLRRAVRGHGRPHFLTRFRLARSAFLPRLFPCSLLLHSSQATHDRYSRAATRRTAWLFARINAKILPRSFVRWSGSVCTVIVTDVNVVTVASRPPLSGHRTTACVPPPVSPPPPTAPCCRRHSLRERRVVTWPRESGSSGPCQWGAHRAGPRGGATPSHL